jgi:hypothetical protein
MLTFETERAAVCVCLHAYKNLVQEGKQVLRSRIFLSSYFLIIFSRVWGLGVTKMMGSTSDVGFNSTSETSSLHHTKL